MNFNIKYVFATTFLFLTVNCFSQVYNNYSFINGTYASIDSVVATGKSIVQKDKNVIIKAVKKIVFKNGFVSESGCVLSAFIITGLLKDEELIESNKSIFETPDLNNEVIIYPNPTNGVINIKTGITDFFPFDFYIININGAIIYENKFVQKEIDISFLHKGIYIVKIVSKNIAVIKRIVVE